MMTSEAARAKSFRDGFTLIEVLVAILVLALGLLGLGAIFPIVIAQQRNAVAIVEGESVASVAEAVVTSSSEIIDFSDWFDPTVAPPNNFGKAAASDTFYSYEWVVGPLAPYGSYPNQPGFEGGFGGSSNGQWFVDLENLPVMANPLEMNQVLTVADRLIPQPYSGKEPKYVWDIVARRVPGSGRPQLGIFIRQIDHRIHVPLASTLSDVLVIGDGTNEPVLPVAIDLTNGRPAVDDGRAGSTNIVYAAVQTLQVQVVKDHLDWLIFEDANNFMLDTSISFAAQKGQKLLDNTGTVRTVLGPPSVDTNIPLLQDPTVRIVRVDPPFRPSQAAVVAGSYDMNANNPATAAVPESARASWVRQIVFTPRTPFAVRVVTLEEDSP